MGLEYSRTGAVVLKSPRAASNQLTPPTSCLCDLFCFFFFKLAFFCSQILSNLLLVSNYRANQKKSEGKLAVFSLKGQASVGFVQPWRPPRHVILFQISSCDDSSSGDVGARWLWSWGDPRVGGRGALAQPIG